MKQRLCCLLAAVVCMSLAGCYQKVADQNGLTFSFAPWVSILVALAGLAAVPIGIVLFLKRQFFWGIVLVIAGPLAAILLAPGLYLDYVTVNQRGFYSRHGLWFNPTVHDIRYDDLTQVRVTVEERSTRRGKSYSYFFDCSFKNGQQERVPLGDIMREALPEIAEQFRTHGVPMHIPANLPN